MKSIDEILKDDHVTKVIGKGIDGAMFNVRINYRLYNVIASNGGGWDHVSIDPINQGHAPTWDVMCVLKDICFNDDETVIEYHPAKENYVNIAENCLHLWRPQQQAIPVPPKLFV